MTTYILTANKAQGTAWLAANVLTNQVNNNNIRYKTKSKVILRNGDAFQVIHNITSCRYLVVEREHSTAISINAPDALLTEFRKYNIPIIEDILQINDTKAISPIERKRKTLELQLDDLIKEENLTNIISNLQIDGCRFSPPVITTSNRLFKIIIEGQFL